MLRIAGAERCGGGVPPGETALRILAILQRMHEDYKDQVVKGLGYAEGAEREDMTAADVAAVREVLLRKAGAFWVEGTPRTALRYLLHDTIPTGPPCRTPPHRLG